MGIIVRDDQSGEIVFYMKGADTVMNRIVQYNDWLEEECSNMAREGLRTLVVAKRILTDEQYAEFDARHQAAKLSVTDRAARVAAVVESLERDMELLGVTGVEDRLQVEHNDCIHNWGSSIFCIGKCENFVGIITQCWDPHLDADRR